MEGGELHIIQGAISYPQGEEEEEDLTPLEQDGRRIILG